MQFGSKLWAQDKSQSLKNQFAPFVWMYNIQATQILLEA
jgi:hypothetical protein